MNRRALLGSKRESYMLMHFDNNVDFYTQYKILQNDGYAGSIEDNTTAYEIGDTSIYKFGGRSFYLDGQYTHQGNNFALNDLPSGDYTIEFWLYKDNITWNNAPFINVFIAYYNDRRTQTHLLAAKDSDPGNIYVGFSNGSTEMYKYADHNSNCTLSRFYDSNRGCYVYECANNTWCHVALTYKRSTNTAKLYLAGQRVLTFYPFGQLGGLPSIAFGNSSYGTFLHIDEIRVSDKIQYTGDTLTVPTSAFLN